MLNNIAKQVMEDWGQDPDTPITPDHLKEAYRRYKKSHSFESGSLVYKKQLFK